MIHYPLIQINKPTPLTFPAVSRPLPSRSSLRCDSLAFPNSAVSKGMKWFHEIELEVRDYELDQYGVVNNSVYSNYCELGTHKLMDKIGFDAGIGLAVFQMSAKYSAPLRKNDKFLLKMRICDYSACRLYFEDIIVKLPNQEPILNAKSTVVVLDKNNRLCRLPESFISNFNHFISYSAADS